MGLTKTLAKMYRVYDEYMCKQPSLSLIFVRMQCAPVCFRAQDVCVPALDGTHDDNLFCNITYIYIL